MEPAKTFPSVVLTHRREMFSHQSQEPADQSFPNASADPVGIDGHPENAKESLMAQLLAQTHPCGKFFNRIDSIFQQHRWAQPRRSVPVQHWRSFSSFCSFSCLKLFDTQSSQLTHLHSSVLLCQQAWHY